MLLQAPVQGFAVADRQANGFQPMIALLEMQDLAVSEYGAIVADDPKLKVNVDGRRHAGIFRKWQRMQPPNYPPSPTQATNLPRFLLLSMAAAERPSRGIACSARFPILLQSPRHLLDGRHWPVTCLSYRKSKWSGCGRMKPLQ